MDNFFQYEPIVGEVKDGIIRIIEIQPGSDVDPIACHISTVRLSSRPRYDALSYCWAKPIFNKQIQCNGKSLAITGSLHSALHHLRDHGHSRMLWVDAICINQQDVDERSQQVRLMRYIYQLAVRVRVWLGEEADDSQLGMALIPKIIKADKIRDEMGDARSWLEILSIPNVKVYNLPGRFDKAWQAFFTILNRPWFNRGWIIQEIAVAAVIDIHCGNRSVTFEEFARALVFTHKNGLAGREHFHLPGRVFPMAFTRGKTMNQSGQSLLSLLLRHRMTLTTDPRDKIFSLCGIATDVGPSELNISIDYRRSAPEVYWETTVHMISLEKRLDVLSVPNEDRVLELPSWVPDFSMPVFTNSLIRYVQVLSFIHTPVTQ